MARLSQILTRKSENNLNECWITARLSSMKMFISLLEIIRDELYLLHIDNSGKNIPPTPPLGDGDIQAQRLLDIDWCS